MDDDEIFEGYRDGFKNEPEPGNNRSFSYWHGWRNGRADRTGEADAAQRELARDYFSSDLASPQDERGRE